MWQLPDRELSVQELNSRRLDSVLVESDGPEITAVWGPGDTRRLSIASDEDEGAVRWIEAALEPELWLNLLAGKLSLHEALQQAVVWVIDQTRDGVPLRGWRIPSTALDARLLPEPGALLPTETRRRFLLVPRIAASQSVEDKAVPLGRAEMHRLVA